MAFDVASFLNDIGLPDEDRTSVLTLFGKHPEAVTKIEARLNAQVESALAPLKADFDKKSRDLDAQFETLDSIRGTDSKNYDEAVSRAEKAAAALAQAKERIVRLATDAGVDPNTFLKDLGTVEPPPVNNPPPNNNNGHAYDPAKVTAEANRAGWVALNQGALLEDIATEHLSLFGTPFTSRAELLGKYAAEVKRTGNVNLGLRDFWQGEYKVNEKRAELTEADVQKRITQAVEKAKLEERDAAALRFSNTPQPTFEHSPVLASIQPKERPAHVGGASEAVVAAIKDYADRVSVRKTA